MSTEGGPYVAGRLGWPAVAAPALLLLTPFIVFIRHHAYPLFSAEIIGCLLVMGAVGGSLGSLARRFPAVAPLVIAGSIVGLVDLQFDVSVPIDGVGESAALLAAIVALTAILKWAGARALMLVGVMAAAAFATTLATPADPLTLEERGSVPGIKGQGPFILHLILDEHIGLSGLRAAGKTDEAERLKRFLEGEGFLVYAAAYSEHFYTFHSLGHAVNFVSGQYIKGLVELGPSPYRWRLMSNRYLTGLATARYAIDIYQSDHLDFCHSTGAVASCRTYASRKLGVLQETALRPMQRGTILLGVFMARSDIWNEVMDFYGSVRDRAWPALPAWVRQVKVSPIGAVSALARLERDLRSARRGQAVIAHVLLPHGPFVYDAECGLLPPSDWLDSNEWSGPRLRNTPEGKAVRYTKYVDQLACTQRWIARLLRAIPDEVRRDAIVIIHGDHGSRITIGPEPPAPPLESDDIDTYSTLFAIRSPAIATGLDVRQSSISCLLSEFVASDFNASLGPDACQGHPVVVVPVNEQRLARPLRRFDAGVNGTGSGPDTPPEAPSNPN